jgi:hypothetical protein
MYSMEAYCLYIFFWARLLRMYSMETYCLYSFFWAKLLEMCSFGH